VDLSGVQSMATANDDPYVRHLASQWHLRNRLNASKQAWEQSMEAGDKF
jgi:hypothetical protein